MTELDWVSDAVPEGLAVLVTLAVAERLGVCVVVGVLDMDCEAVWLCVGVLLGEQTFFCALSCIPPNAVSTATVVTFVELADKLATMGRYATPVPAIG